MYYTGDREKSKRFQRRSRPILLRGVPALAFGAAVGRMSTLFGLATGAARSAARVADAAATSAWSVALSPALSSLNVKLPLMPVP